MRGWQGLVVAALLSQPLAAAQEVAPYQPPRTAAGHPDFQGVWGAEFLTRLERPKGFDALVPSDEQAIALTKIWMSSADGVTDPDFTHFGARMLAVVKGTVRASQIVEPADGRLPFSKQALDFLNADQPATFGYDNPEETGASIRCINGVLQAPIRTLPLLIPMQIVQTRDAVVLQTEDVAGFRLINLTGSPPPDVVRSFDGYAAGRWEGDTLVVETTHLRADDPMREHFGRPILVGAGSKVIERFTRLSDSELLYQFTVEDPSLYQTPWLAEYALTRADLAVREYACHEANYSLTNVLLAGRMGLHNGRKP